MTEPIGILLAAGLGTRLQPLTLVRPKPLVPMHGVPLLEFGLRQMERAGCRLVAVNGHHLADTLEAWLRLRMAAQPTPEIRFFREPVLLGVGGGLARMARELPPGPLLVQNGDVVHDGDLDQLCEAALAAGRGVALAVGGLPRVVEVARGHVLSLRDPQRSTHGFTGVHVWGADARDRLCAWQGTDLIPFLQQEVAAGHAPLAVPLARVDKGSLWLDLGHLARYLPLHAELWELPAYRRLLESLELEASWDARRRLSLGSGSLLPDDAENCVAWDQVRWEGQARDTVFLDHVVGRGRATGEIIL